MLFSIVFQEYIIAEKEIEMLELKTYSVFVNAVLYELGPKFCYTSMAPQNEQSPI